MIILKAFKDLTLMKNILDRELPQSITVLGGVLHILHNNPCHPEMCVDSWPTFTIAICYRQKQVAHRDKENLRAPPEWPLDVYVCLYMKRFSSSSSSSSSSGMIPDICTVYTKNPDTLRSLLLNERVVNWRNGLIFRGIPSSHCLLIKELASLSGSISQNMEVITPLSTTARRMWICKTSVHTFSAWQELIAAANFHPGKIPRRARRHTLALRRQPGEPGPPLLICKDRV
ncbi:putative glycine N-acyltransferase-like protein 1B [Dissostichus eleginoides]|uniref:Glycine N-acyltransferase-like protein n=1 Tax=Dissostichus eleginoides TaxID=100907 RepID=A0AAD9CC28_DISEL|nr:putative glycine N-acyltransferase-like protein 1B [Dissostichus eleginoides]